MLKTSVLLAISLALLAITVLSSASKLSTVAFLQAMATFLLLVWGPSRVASKVVWHMLYVVSGFFGCAFLLMGLFTLWWPPKDPFTVFWSSLTLVFLFLCIFRSDAT